MKNKNLTFYFLPIVFFVSILLFWSYEEKEKRGAIEVFVASQDIPAGTFLNPRMVAKSRIPISTANSDYIESLHEVEGLTTIVFIPKNKPIAYTQFAPTEKNQSSIFGHNPQNYTLSVNGSKHSAELFKPGTFFYFSGKVNGITHEGPVALFPIVQLVYAASTTKETKDQNQNTTHLFTLTPNQAEALRKLTGKPLKLVIRDSITEEIVSISDLELEGALKK